MGLIKGSSYGGLLLKRKEDSRYSILRQAIESSESSLDQARCHNKSLRVRLSSLRADSLHTLRAELCRNVSIFEAGAEWLKLQQAALEAQIDQERKETDEIRRKREAIETRVEKAVETMAKVMGAISGKKLKGGS